MKKLILFAALALLPFLAKSQNLCPDSRHPHLIDLGLPSGTKWACCNVGAQKPEGYGSFFAWGETSTKSTYDIENYRWFKVEGYVTLFNQRFPNIIRTKYNITASEGTVDDKTQLDLVDDAARAKWHGSWRMPTIVELEELKANCNYEWTTVNGVKGGKFTSRSNGRSIFLPAAGERHGASLGGRGEGGHYWSSSLSRSDELPYELYINSRGPHTNSSGRAIGQSVRPVVTPPLCPDNHHPHVIDLGLPSGTKWACCNVGSSKPEGYGGYYAWGETEEKKVYDWSTYIHCDGSSETCHNIGTDISGTQYDVAHVKWGGSWKMPTMDQVKELLNKCAFKWITENGVNGRKFTGPNGNSIFLPAAGYRWNDYLGRAGSDGEYWSSTLGVSDPSVASYLLFSSGSANWGLASSRCGGNTVRPVR